MLHMGDIVICLHLHKLRCQGFLSSRLVNDPDFLHPCNTGSTALALSIDARRCYRWWDERDVTSPGSLRWFPAGRSSSLDQIPLTSLFHESLLFERWKMLKMVWALKLLGSCCCSLRTCPFTDTEGTMFCSKESMSDSCWYLMSYAHTAQLLSSNML